MALTGGRPAALARSSKPARRRRGTSTGGECRQQTLDFIRFAIRAFQATVGVLDSAQPFKAFAALLATVFV